MRFLLSCFIAILFFNVSAQDYTSEILLDNAKNGFLLFRLPTQSKKIEALRRAGQNEEGDKLKANMEVEQQAWVNAFKAEYDYGKVYFFFDYNARAIAARDLSSVFDFNFNLEENLEENFLVAGPDQTKTFSLNGIVILTPEMKEVPKKMPKFISAYGFAHLSKKSYFQMVKELNALFLKYD
jgi:hypothetical protein